MSTLEAETYLNSPNFREALRHFQVGEWDAGLSKLKGLEDKYPLEHELRTLRQEMQMRARLDHQEVDERKRLGRRRTLAMSVRTVILVLMITVAAWGGITYSSWFQRQVANLTEQYEREAQSLALAVKLRSAQELVRAGRATEALLMLREIETVDPTLPGLPESMAQAEQIAALETRYNEAVVLTETGELSQALVILQDIAAQDPLFKDVSLRIEELNRSFLIEELIVQADQSFQAGNWQDAVTGYEAARAIDPAYRADVVQDRLYQSYLKQAELVLADPAATLEALSMAEDYFRKALALRPQDQTALVERAAARAKVEERLVNTYIASAQAALVEQADSLEALQIAESYFSRALQLAPDDGRILVQYDLARRYLSAIDSFTKGLWGEVIDQLEVVYTEDADYAGGTARQTLYEAYMASGKDRLTQGDYANSLADFQRAAVLAQESPDAVLLLYEAQLMVAETQGLLGNYEDAVLLYRAAVDKAGIAVLALERNTTLANNLYTAESSAGSGDYTSAYVVYRDALRNSGGLYNETVHVVLGGEYLTMLARRYNTTVNAILRANGISSRSKLDADLRLVIPRLP